MKLTNKLGLPLIIEKAVEYWAGHHDAQADYSVTELLDTPRRIALMRRHADEISEDVSERGWSLLGSSVHKVVEAAFEADEDDRLVVEHRMFGELDGVTFSGQCDTYDKSTNTIYDLKTASVWEIINGVREEREQQLNCYAYLGRNAEKWPVDNIAAIFILRDWSKKKAEREPDYPQSQMFVYPLRMWTDNEAEEFIRWRIKVHEGAKVDLPYCTPDEQWVRPTEYAVMSAGRKSAHRLLDSAQEAQAWITTNRKGTFVVERPGEAVRCEDYCSVMPLCSQYAARKQLVKA
jgi:hypothetical protein